MPLLWIATTEDTGCGVIMVHSGNAFNENGVKTQTGWIKYEARDKKDIINEKRAKNTRIKSIDNLTIH